MSHFAKKRWQQKLRDSSAFQEMRSGRPDRFPVEEIISATDELFRAQTSSPFSPRQALTPQTQHADEFVAEVLGEFKNELFFYQIGIIACIRVLTFEQARGRIRSIIPDPEQRDQFFEIRLFVYLQTVMLARRVDNTVCSRSESIAALELFTAIQGRADRFPSVLRLIEAIGLRTCEEFLSQDLVCTALKHCQYQDRLGAELQELKCHRRWAHVFKLVGGLGEIGGLPLTSRVIREAIPDYLLWMSWSPTLTRIKTWDAKLSSAHRAQLATILDLEGPDTTGQVSATLCRSSTVFSRVAFAVDGENLPDLDKLLRLLDKAIRIGTHAVDLFTQLCVHSSSLDARRVEQVDAVLKMEDDLAAKKLGDFYKALRGEQSVNDRIRVFAAALPLLQNTPRLQEAFGTNVDFAQRGSTALVEAQTQFCKRLQHNQINERLALQISAFGQALCSAGWLHEMWQPAFLGMVSQIPTEMETNAMMKAFKGSGEYERQRNMDVMAARIGGSRRKGQSSTSIPDLINVPDPVWYEDVDVDRLNFRKMLQSLSDIEISLRTSCVKQSHKEHDTFVRELTNIIRGRSDQVCVNLARFLGSRATTPNSVHDAWKSLLLAMMQQQPSGLLDRCGVLLTYQSWQNWIQSLRRLYGDQHLGSHGGLGFDLEKINTWTKRKRGLDRTVSVSTVSTVSTGVSRMSDVSASWPTSDRI